MKERVILHSDLNNFFASVECVLNPALRGKPIAVCGDPEKRHGVILAKSEEAKKFGVKTAETVWQAQKKCPALILVPPHHKSYKEFSKRVTAIYSRYTDIIEQFSIDECFLDVTASTFLFGDGREIAEKIRRAVKEELALTVSVGVSFNKSTAKLASEIKKPDAVTVILKEDFKARVYPMPVSALLYAGESTCARLNRYNVRTVGDLAACDDKFISDILGKAGLTLLSYARGTENESVNADMAEVKSIGNSFTLPSDISREEDIVKTIYILSESVAERLLNASVGKADTVHITIKDSAFKTYTFQRKVKPTVLCREIAQCACALFKQNYGFNSPVRLLGVSVSGFTHDIEQISLMDDARTDKEEAAEKTISALNKKYGGKITRGVILGESFGGGKDKEEQ